LELKFTEFNSIPLDKFEENLNNYVLQKIKNSVEEKCIEDGYVKKDSVKLLTLSCGVFHSDKVKYTATYECLVCLPVEGMPIRCVAKSISNGGIRAVIADEEVSPVVIFVARETTEVDLSIYKEGDVFEAIVYGVQYELNDTFVSVLAIIPK
jgi:DNA-directed RNA polymerase subunit E'/Rpb7